jgi:predicted enzyme related to lactoylglutathione lyase
MPRVQHFEISANEPEKVAAFYENVFGWKITKWEGPVEYWLVETGGEEEPGINGGISRPDETISGTVNTIGVPDIDAYLEKVQKFGGKVVVDKHIIPGVGYNAYCQDVEGSVFGVHQEDPSASV